MAIDTRNVFYWNSADDKEHTHQRIEWAIENGYLVCINIKIKDKLFSKVKVGDIILAYEPKYHKKSNFENGEDGYCMSCKIMKNNGKQAFTEAFTIINEPILISSYDNYLEYNDLIFRNWFSTDKHCKNIDMSNNYFQTYFNHKKFIYIFPISHFGKLKKEISTYIQGNSEYKYYGNIRKGFNIINDIYLNNLIVNCKLF